MIQHLFIFIQLKTINSHYLGSIKITSNFTDYISINFKVMVRRLLFLLPLMAIFIFSSCTTDSYLTSFSRFVDRTDAQCHYYSYNKWEKNINKFTKYSVDRFSREKAKLSPSELKAVLDLDARYAAILSSEGVIQTKGVVEEVKKQGPAYLQQFLDVFNRRTENGDDR